MKSSFRKMRGLAFRKHDRREKRDAGLGTYQDELIQASQDMLDMRNCYDNLLSAAAATVNSAYEFSEALKELGTCLLQKTALDDDEESGRALLMLGKVQFELQKLVDNYRVHIIQTIATPSESLVKELQTVEDMKRQCDEKRELCEFMIATQKEKGTLRSTKGGQSVTQEQLQATQDDYREEATLFVFRLKSLKQGQSRSLLTQAARHHAAQLNFFRKAVKSLEVVEPHVKIVAEQQHIDYQFIGLEDDDTEQEVDDHDGNADGEVSVDYAENDQGQDAISLSRNSLEENLDRPQAEYHFFNRDPRAASMSAPLFPDKKIEFSERLRQMQPASTNKFHSYVLPTPVDVKNSSLKGSDKTGHASRVVFKEGFATQLWHSSPLQPNMLGKDTRDLQLPNPTNFPKTYSSTLKENINSGPIRIPTPPHEELSMSQFSLSASDAKKIKRQAFSGPLTSQAPSDKSILSASVSSAIPPKPGLAQKAPNASPPRITSPRISELHELPRPPVGTAKAAKPSGLVGYSGPLMHRGPGLTASNKSSTSSSYTASPLPTPPGAMTRSFSIPSSCQRTSNITVSELLDVRTSQNMSSDISSPPLTPISFTVGQPASTTPRSVDQATKPKGVS